MDRDLHTDLLAHGFLRAEGPNTVVRSYHRAASADAAAPLGEISLAIVDFATDRPSRFLEQAVDTVRAVRAQLFGEGQFTASNPTIEAMANVASLLIPNRRTKRFFTRSPRHCVGIILDAPQTPDWIADLIAGPKHEHRRRCIITILNDRSRHAFVCPPVETRLARAFVDWLHVTLDR